MKKENIKYYIGIVVGLVGSAFVWFFVENKIIHVALNLIFLWIGAFSYVTLLNKEMLKDKEYRISLADEREIRIREKTGESISWIFLLYFAFLSMYFILNDNFLAAFLTGGVIFIYPLVYKIVSTIHGRKI